MTVTMLDSLPTQKATMRAGKLHAGGKHPATDFSALVDSAGKADAAPVRRRGAHDEALADGTKKGRKSDKPAWKQAADAAPEAAPAEVTSAPAQAPTAVVADQVVPAPATSGPVQASASSPVAVTGPLERARTSADPLSPPLMHTAQAAVAAPVVQPHAQGATGMAAPTTQPVPPSSSGEALPAAPMAEATALLGLVAGAGQATGAGRAVMMAAMPSAPTPTPLPMPVQGATPTSVQTATAPSLPAQAQPSPAQSPTGTSEPVSVVVTRAEHAASPLSPPVLQSEDEAVAQPPRAASRTMAAAIDQPVPAMANDGSVAVKVAPPATGSVQGQGAPAAGAVVIPALVAQAGLSTDMAKTDGKAPAMVAARMATAGVKPASSPRAPEVASDAAGQIKPAAPAKGHEDAAARARVADGDGGPVSPALAALTSPVASPDPSSGVASLDVGAIATNTATPDLGASLGQSVVDLAVGNQWLDGVSRDIAHVVAREGQGSFHLSPENLGAMRVDIRNTALGPEADLTVKTEAARAALSADNDLRRAENQPGVRIADIRVDRVNHVADSAQANAGGQNPAGQGGWNQGQGQSQSAQAQNMSQNGNGAGHGGGNAQGAAKALRDAAVIGSGDSQDRRDDRGGRDGRGTRYA
ncbi:hypothetical protein [Sphingobium aquiterrae]|uniref:hypothetical protein n=1 Tax=Sphingobium aquiterrae TaxID=2038656 RepID=UPI003018C119